MSNESTNVSVGKPKVAGAIYRGSTSATLPTDATSELSSDFTCLGYVSDGGVTNSYTIDTGEIKAWGGDTVYTYDNGRSDTFKYKLIEALNADVLEAIYGSDNVSGDISSGLTIKVNSDEQESAAWIIDMILRGEIAKRIVIPDAKITSLGDIVYSDGEAIGYDLTLTALPDADGQTHYEYLSAATTTTEE